MALFFLEPNTIHTYKAIPAYKAFLENPQIIFCSTFYIGYNYKAFSL